MGVGHQRADVDDRLLAERQAGDVGDLLGHGLVLADRPAPLHPLVRPLTGDLERPLGGRGADRGEREPAGVQGGERDLQAQPLGADQVLGGNAHVLEPGDPVLDAPQAHERVAVLDGDAGRMRVDDEGADAAAMTLGARHLGHHHQPVGDDPVGGPELEAVEDVCRAILCWDRRTRHPRGVAAHVVLGEQEGADLGRRHQRQVLALLLLGAEEHQRLGDADRLVGAEQGADRAAHRSGELQGAGVVELGEPDAAVLDGDGHAQGAELRQAADHVVGDLAVALDHQRVDAGAQELLEPRQELLAALPRLGRGTGMGMDEVEPEATEEELLAEAGEGPLRLACRLGNLSRLSLGAHVQIPPRPVTTPDRPATTTTVAEESASTRPAPPSPPRWPAGPARRDRPPRPRATPATAGCRPPRSPGRSQGCPRRGGGRRGGPPRPARRWRGAG